MSETKKRNLNKKMATLLAEVYQENEAQNKRIADLLKEIAKEEEKQKESEDSKKKSTSTSQKTSTPSHPEALKSGDEKGLDTDESEEYSDTVGTLTAKDMKRAIDMLSKMSSGSRMIGEDGYTEASKKALPSTPAIGYIPPTSGKGLTGSDKVYCGVCRKYHTRGTHD